MKKDIGEKETGDYSDENFNRTMGFITLFLIIIMLSIMSLSVIFRGTMIFWI